MEGEAGFRAREIVVIADLLAQHDVVLATGGGAVVDPRNQQSIKKESFVVFLNTSVEQQYERTRRDRKRPLLQTQDPLAVLTQLMKVREPIYRSIASFIVSTDHKRHKTVVKEIINAIRGSGH